MSNINLKCKYSLLIAVIILLLSSCRKDDEVNPDYVGTWSAYENVTVNGITINIKDKMTFTKAGLSDVWQIYYMSRSEYLDYLKMNGTISVNGNIMNVKITEIGMTRIDSAGMPTGAIVLYKEGSNEYNKLFDQTGLPKSYKLKFVVSGINMTINETTVYIKQ